MQMRILSIDGGGIRGIIPALVLAEIEKRTGKRVAEIFDVIAGTSTGGILSLGLCVPDTTGRPKFSAAQLAGLYGHHGEKIFEKRSKIGIVNRVGSLFNETYSQKGIEYVLEEYFGDVMLSTSLSNLVITSYDLESGRTFIFKSRLARKNPVLEDFPMRYVARSTSAAPTYFEPNPVVRDDVRLALIDGGVFANNPAALAFAEAKEIHRKARWNQPMLRETDSESSGARDFAGDPVDASQISEPFYLLSLGTGSSQKPIKYEDAKSWGMVQWVRPVIHIMMQGSSESVHYQMRQLLPPRLDSIRRYDRLNVENMDPDHIEMDNASPENIEALTGYATRLISDNSERIDMICKALSTDN